MDKQGLKFFNWLQFFSKVTFETGMTGYVCILKPIFLETWQHSLSPFDQKNTKFFCELRNNFTPRQPFIGTSKPIGFFQIGKPFFRVSLIDQVCCKIQGQCRLDFAMVRRLRTSMETTNASLGDSQLLTTLVGTWAELWPLRVKLFLRDEVIPKGVKTFCSPHCSSSH
jgi:hypothetical protein